MEDDNVFFQSTSDQPNVSFHHQKSSIYDRQWLQVLLPIAYMVVHNQRPICPCHDIKSPEAQAPRPRVCCFAG